MLGRGGFFLAHLKTWGRPVSGELAIKKADLLRRAELVRRRKNLDRESRDLAASILLIDRRVEAYLRQEVGRKKDRSIVKFGFLMRLVTKRASVKWKDAFVALAGETAAVELRGKMPLVDRVEIEKL